MGRCHSPPLFQRLYVVYGPATNPDNRLTIGPLVRTPQTDKSVFITPRGFYLCGRSVMTDKGERVMHHITTHYIPAKRRHIDAETRLRRLSHLVAASTRVVRGCKLPRRPSARFCPHAESRRPAFSVWAVDSSCPYPSSFGSVCGVPAKAEKFFGAFAAFLQRPKSFSRRLQRSCKGQKVFRGVCSIPAKAKKFFEAFAAFLQRPKSFSRCLQHSCKGQKVSRGICSVPASTRVFAFIPVNDMTQLAISTF